MRTWLIVLLLSIISIAYAWSRPKEPLRAPEKKKPQALPPIPKVREPTAPPQVKKSDIKTPILKAREPVVQQAKSREPIAKKPDIVLPARKVREPVVRQEKPQQPIVLPTPAKQTPLNRAAVRDTLRQSRQRAAEPSPVSKVTGSLTPAPTNAPTLSPAILETTPPESHVVETIPSPPVLKLSGVPAHSNDDYEVEREAGAEAENEVEESEAEIDESEEDAESEDDEDDASDFTDYSDE